MDLTIFRQSTIPFTILWLVIFVYAVLSISRSSRNKTTARKPPPPEAGGAWHVIGHLHLLGGSQPPHITLGNMADKYGPIFTVRLGVHPTLIVNSWEIAKECFTVNDRAFASCPKLIAFEVMGYNFGMIGFSPYGPYWRHVRKIATLEVLSNHRLEMLKHVRESEVKSAMKDTYDRWLELNKNGLYTEAAPLSCEMKKWFGEITLNVVFRMVVGKRFAEPQGKETTQNVALILAATDTTTVTLTWASSLLMNNRQVLKKAVHEIDTQVGRERVIVESDLKNLHYLQAILKETIRLYPAGPLSVIHESMEDCTVAGYHIPSGTRL